MTLTFLGTRGNVDVRSRRHLRHTSTLVSYRRAHIMIDCGADWLGRLHHVKPSAIVLTHGHSDHVGGLRRGAPCAVYATDDVWRLITRWPLNERKQLKRRAPTRIHGMVFEAFPVEHSVRAPAVGYRITCGRKALFYVPDVLSVPHPREALSGIVLYVGDGASVVRPIVRRKNDTAVGHASIATQLEWCAEAGVPRAIFTHCGTRVVVGAREVEQRITTLGMSHGIETRVAYDGLKITVP
jgi:phosphoribosyl 1,2-cyclic phosphodiesterase